MGEVARRLGVTTHSLYAWKDKFGGLEMAQRVAQDQNAVKFAAVLLASAA